MQHGALIHSRENENEVKACKERKHNPPQKLSTIHKRLKYVPKIILIMDEQKHGA